MIIKNERDVIKLVQEDHWMMDILLAAKALELPDWWICAGFVRNKIWDTLHHFSERTVLSDIDVIYFDHSLIDEKHEKKLEEKLKKTMPKIPWEVKNEARMHVMNDLSPYSSSVDAISKFPETVTALGLKLDKNNNLILAAPCGIQDVINLEVKPTPHFLSNKELLSIYRKRITQKNWKSIWNKIKIIYP
ncbi:nucleotidyltransferase family protein [Chengkuizengella sediminis]|uniref:nucleotidyltransferase family protein n=1 Tax=Chengkuizengella sediminis TaxID=1885917 RepID=UPI00138A128E|nr:nucleotidyltransferase family protein [Chengkuizengella sediminis]NDI33895.1 nucleotidyltransferase family protein [Chengkuizengella sediminis]